MKVALVDDESAADLDGERLRLEHPTRLGGVVANEVVGSVTPSSRKSVAGTVASDVDRDATGSRAQPTRASALAAPIACGCCLLAGAAYVAIDRPARTAVCSCRARSGR